MSKVSVIIPVYGVEKYIERCARSLFEQTLDDIEYLFIDDCTPDNSIGILTNVLEEYPNRKSQVIIHRMEKNSGQAAVREWGLRNATGEFIIHCDSDDWVDTDMYRKMYDKAIQDNADYVICDYAVSDGIKILNKVKGCHTTSKELLIQNFICLKDAVPLWNKLIKRNIIEKEIIPTKYNVGEDYLQSINFLLNSSNISYVPQSFYNYFININSITNEANKDKRIKNLYHNKANLDILISIFERKDLYRKYEDCFVAAKWHVKEKIEFSLSHKKECLEWHNIYPEIHRKILFNPFLSFKKKIKFILIYFRLFHIFHKR